MPFRFVRSMSVILILGAASVTSWAQEAEIPVISSIETDRILENTGQTVTVTGTVTRTGKSKDGGITFLNFSNQRGGFVVVVFRADYDSFPDGPEVYLNKEVHVTGEVKPYQGSTPQIQLRSPDQIKVIEQGSTP